MWSRAKCSSQHSWRTALHGSFKFLQVLQEEISPALLQTSFFRMFAQWTDFQHSDDILSACVLIASVVSDSATPWTVVRQAPLSIGFSRQEYWSGCHTLLRGISPTQGSYPGLSISSPEDPPKPGIEAVSPVLLVDSLPTELKSWVPSIQDSFQQCISLPALPGPLVILQWSKWETEKKISCILTDICVITEDLIYKAEIETRGAENKGMDTKARGGVGCIGRLGLTRRRCSRSV